MLRTYLVRLCLALAIVSGVTSLCGADWPQFRGPSGTGCATSAETLPTEWGGGGIGSEFAWQTTIPGTGWSSPIVVGKSIWLTSAEQTALSDRGRQKKLAENPILTPDFQTHSSVTLLACEVDLKTGKRLRTLELLNVDDPKPIHGQNTYASPTAASDGERLYCHFGSLGTVCVDLATGKTLWQKTLSVDELTGPGGSPVLWKNSLIFACDGTDQQFVVSLDKRTGEEQWKTPRPKIDAPDGKHHRAFSTPLVIEHQGQEQLISVGSQWACAYDPATGQERWRANFRDGHAVVPRPVYRDGIVYICTGYMKPQLWAIDVAGQGDVTDTHVLWTCDSQVPEISSPLVAGKELYFVSAKGILTCLDAVSGDELWKHRLGGNFAASPLLADGKLYVTNQEGTTFVLKPGRTFAQIAANQHFGQTLASLAVAGDSLLIRTQSQLLCVRKNSAANQAAVRP
jgi:outer membrane protein assembly factor BamB